MKEKNQTFSSGMAGSLRAKLKDKNGKELLETKIQGNIEKRFSKRTGKAIQIVRKDGKIVHIHCKDKDCGNEWKQKDSSDWKNKFEVNDSTIKCLKCVREYKIG
jgi:hypothetical protein